MKISSSVRRIYDEQHKLNKLLESRVKSIFETKKKPAWFFTSRIKELESFAQKLETGRVIHPEALEDFFASTLVVENRSAIAQAIALIEEQFEIVKRRPKEVGKTHKSPDSFPFDDLRLYVKLKSNDSLPKSELEELVFEIQIKTFLQHAWGIATHDLIYKGDNIDWGKARVAFQIKAMLEHAEVSVEQVDTMAKSDALSMCDPETRDKQTLILWLKRTWDQDALPKDLVRLSDTILNLLTSLKLKIDDLVISMQKDTDSGAGAKLHNFSPYAVIVRSLYENHREKFNSFLGNRSPKGFKIFLSDDPELMQSLKESNQEKLIYLGESDAP